MVDCATLCQFACAGRNQSCKRSLHHHFSEFSFKLVWLSFPPIPVSFLATLQLCCAAFSLSLEMLPVALGDGFVDFLTCEHQTPCAQLGWCILLHEMDIPLALAHIYWLAMSLLSMLLFLFQLCHICWDKVGVGGTLIVVLGSDCLVCVLVVAVLTLNLA